MISAKMKNRKKNCGVYFEKHHIVPNFMFENRKGRKGPKGYIKGDPDSIDNIVLLTPREHFLAHILLCKIYQGTIYEFKAKKSLVWFYTKMESTTHKRNDWYKLSKTKKYQRYRECSLDALSKEMKGKIIAKDAVSGELVGKVPVDHPKVKSGDWVHHSTGRKAGESERKKLRERNAGMKNPNARPDITNKVLIDTIMRYIEINNLYGCHIISKEAIHYLSDVLGCSIAIIRNRFGNFEKFIKETNKTIAGSNKDIVKYNPYYRSEERNELNSELSKKYCWVTNGENNIRILKDDLKEFIKVNKHYRRGRVIINDKN